MIVTVSLNIKVDVAAYAEAYGIGTRAEAEADARDYLPSHVRNTVAEALDRLGAGASLYPLDGEVAEAVHCNTCLSHVHHADQPMPGCHLCASAVISAIVPDDEWEPTPCAACGWVESNVPTSADNAHDNLCCGSAGACTDDPLCVSHMPDPDPDPEPVDRCPACGDVIDYCLGHGEIGDPAGRAILDAHDDGDHANCAPEGCADAADARLALAVPVPAPVAAWDAWWDAHPGMADAWDSIVEEAKATRGSMSQKDAVLVLIGERTMRGILGPVEAYNLCEYVNGAPLADLLRSDAVATRSRS